jgi:hypothetical protein
VKPPTVVEPDPLLVTDPAASELVIEAEGSKKPLSPTKPPTELNEPPAVTEDTEAVE